MGGIMEEDSARRDRLRRIVQLAQVYRGWTRADASRALGREFNKVVPDSGNPKLDLVVALAEALDWSVGEVAEAVWPGNSGKDIGQEAEGEITFESLDMTARGCHRAGDWPGLIRTALQMAAVAPDARGRGLAANRLAGGWDALGRYSKALVAVQTGLAEPGLPSDLRLMLEVNLANAHYALWHLVEARATADSIIRRFAAARPGNRLEDVAEAFSFYVRGSTHRRMIESDPEGAATHASRAREDLCAALAGYTTLAERWNDDSYLGLANTCRGAIIEVETVLGIRQSNSALEAIAEGLGSVVDVAAAPAGDRLESWGWWAIFGCNIALREPTAPRTQQFLAVFSNKAAEIAERLDNWSLRERAFTLEHLRRRKLEAQSSDEPWVLDREEVRTIAGTMGRFPAFRDIGWNILESASVVDA